MTLIALIVLIGTIVAGGVVGVLALIWAERHSQFTNVSAGAWTIFEDHEPVDTSRDLVWAPDEPVDRRKE